MYCITQIAVHTTINIQTNINISKMIVPSEQATKSRNRNNRIRQIGSCERAFTIVTVLLNKHNKTFALICL